MVRLKSTMNYTKTIQKVSKNKRYNMSNKIDINDIYFKIHCIYNAKTEIYDIALDNYVQKIYNIPQDMCFNSKELKHKSIKFANRLYDNCKFEIERITGKKFDISLWKKCIIGYKSLTGQSWINMYNTFIENDQICDNVDIMIPICNYLMKDGGIYESK